MPDINITTNLSITGTKLSIDSKDITKKEKVVGISLYATSPHKDDKDSLGYISVDVTTVDEEGTVETKSYRKSQYLQNKLPLGKILKDCYKDDKALTYIGNDVPIVFAQLIDKIIEHCDANKIKCPDKEVLYQRTLSSLKDKATDLGIEKVVIDGDK